MYGVSTGKIFKIMLETYLLSSVRVRSANSGFLTKIELFAINLEGIVSSALLWHLFSLPWVLEVINHCHRG